MNWNVVWLAAGGDVLKRKEVLELPMVEFVEAVEYQLENMKYKRE